MTVARQLAGSSQRPGHDAYTTPGGRLYDHPWYSAWTAPAEVVKAAPQSGAFW